MIFSKFFKKKKWLSEKVSERLAAVAELDTSEAQNKSILHELAFNDGDEKVRRAALEKLNDFSLFWQSFKKDSSDNIKKLSERALVDNLIGKRQSNIDETLKRQFIQECNKTQLLEQVVFQLQDDTLIEQTLVKLNKEHLYMQALQHSDLTESLKLTLLQQVGDETQLKKLSKKLQGPLLAQVEQKLAVMQAEQALPIKLEKQMRLILAQYNALKDKSDVALVEAKIAEIEAQWQQTDFSILANEVERELSEKYQTISASLQRILAPKKQEWLAQQQQNERLQQQADNFTALSDKLSALEAKITQSIVDGKEMDHGQLTQDINQLKQDATELALAAESKAAIVTRTETLFNRADQLPLIKAGIKTAESLIEQLAELSLPEDHTSLNAVHAEFKRIKFGWRDNLKQVDIAMPESLVTAYKGLLDKWQPVISELEKSQKQLFNQTRRKLGELENLVKIGKFHSAFGLFKKLGHWFEELNDYQKGQLERKWQAAQQQIDDLHDLEKSFSNPKKSELLQDIRKIAEQPLMDPTEQAHKVRLLRSNWQSLGHAEDEQEQGLNQEFDQLCEQAFAPCREHYKALEDERQQHLEAKLLIIEQLETMASSLVESEVNDWRSLESLFVKLNKLWRETGQIDREKISATNKRYHAAVKPIKAAINHHHSSNEAKKRALIEDAKAIAHSEDSLADKTEALKQLQVQWRAIGFAGNKHDQKLWLAFRAVNNPIFEQRDTDKQAEKAEAKQAFDTIAQELAGVAEKVERSQVLAELRNLAEEAQVILANVTGLARQDYEKIKRSAAAVQTSVEQKLLQLRKQKQELEYVQLFDAVSAIAKGESADISNLKPAWQTAINSSHKGNREEVTLQIEISANLTSPESQQSMRNSVQMAMLSAKLEQGIEFNLEDLLEAWLAAGIFVEEDVERLVRIKAAYT